MNVFGTQVSITFVPVQCCNCGMWFGVDQSWQQRLHNSGDWFYCPKGHQQHYSESELDRVKRHLKYAESSAERAHQQAESERRGRIALKGQLTKTKNRIANGVCPCCNRSFTNLQRHMSGQHPEFEHREVPSARKATKRPSQSEVRAWAVKKGVEVNRIGRVPDYLVERYLREVAA